MNPRRLQRETTFSIKSVFFGSAIRSAILTKTRGKSRKANTHRPAKRRDTGLSHLAFALHRMKPSARERMALFVSKVPVSNR